MSLHKDCQNKGYRIPYFDRAHHPHRKTDGEFRRLVKQAGLFTFPNSSKHHVLYQKFGFYPRFLTYIMVKSVGGIPEESARSQYSQLTSELRRQSLNGCLEITNAIYPGLDVSSEIIAVYQWNLGDTVLLWEDKELIGFAVCHCGAHTEAGGNDCYIKFAAVKPGINVAANFEKLLVLCENFTVNKKFTRLVAGINTSHEQAYKIMFNREFRIENIGVSMHKPNLENYHRGDVFVLDNWR